MVVGCLAFSTFASQAPRPARHLILAEHVTRKGSDDGLAGAASARPTTPQQTPSRAMFPPPRIPGTLSAGDPPSRPRRLMAVACESAALLLLASAPLRAKPTTFAHRSVYRRAGGGREAELSRPFPCPRQGRDRPGSDRRRV
jgi:hypothetical protein